MYVAKGNECQDNYCSCYKMSMATANHWTVEPDPEVSIKVSLPISFWQYHPNSTLYMHKGIVHTCVLLGRLHVTF